MASEKVREFLDELTFTSIDGRRCPTGLADLISITRKYHELYLEFVGKLMQSLLWKESPEGLLLPVEDNQKTWVEYLKSLAGFSAQKSQLELAEYDFNFSSSNIGCVQEFINLVNRKAGKFAAKWFFTVDAHYENDNYPVKFRADTTLMFFAERLESDLFFVDTTPKKSDITLILAGNRHEAELFAQTRYSCKLGPKMVYVSSPQAMMGLREMFYHVVGTFCDRQDADAIIQEVEARGCTEVI